AGALRSHFDGQSARRDLRRAGAGRRHRPLRAGRVPLDRGRQQRRVRHHDRSGGFPGGGLGTGRRANAGVRHRRRGDRGLGRARGSGRPRGPHSRRPARRRARARGVARARGAAPGAGAPRVLRGGSEPVTTSGDELGSDLHVLAILDDSASIELMQRTLSAAGDRLSVATDLAEGLARTAAEVPDVVLVDVTLGQNAGLAVVHHLRALVPDLLVYALARSGALELGSQAVALGGAGVLILPLSGDELISVTSAVRARRAERELRRKLERDAQLSRKLTAVAERLAEIADCRTRREGAEHLARLLVESAGADNALVYLPAGEGARQLMRAAAVEAPGDPPSFCEEIDLLAYADQHDLKVVRLSLRREHSGLLLLSGGPAAGAGDAATWVNVFAAQAATALALIGEREQSSRSA